MEEITVKVSSDVLVRVSSDLSVKLKRAKNVYDQMEGIINGTSVYWEGEGHVSMRNLFQRKKNECARVFSSIEGHIQNLNTIAGNYSSAEFEATAVAQSLPGDVIF